LKIKNKVVLESYNTNTDPCDQTFCETNHPIWLKKSTLMEIYGIFNYPKLLIKMWEFQDKKWPKSGAYIGKFGAIFYKTITPK
jgi:hypothetical protein